MGAFFAFVRAVRLALHRRDLWQARAAEKNKNENTTFRELCVLDIVFCVCYTSFDPI